MLKLPYTITKGVVRSVKHLLQFIHHVLPLPGHRNRKPYGDHFAHHFVLHLVTFAAATATIVGTWTLIVLTVCKSGSEYFSYSVEGGEVVYVGLRGSGPDLMSTADPSNYTLSTADLKNVTMGDLPWMNYATIYPTLPISAKILYLSPMLNLVVFMIFGPLCWFIDFLMVAFQMHRAKDPIRNSASTFAFATGAWICTAELCSIYGLSRWQLRQGGIVVAIVPGLLFWVQCALWVPPAAIWAYAMHHRIKKEGKQQDVHEKEHLVESAKRSEPPKQEMSKVR